MIRSFEYPVFYDAAGAASKKGQDRYMGAVAVRLVALAFAALGGALSLTVGTIDIFPWVALAAFVVALAAETYILTATPDQLWYEGRAAAESAKTLAWRFAVGGDPFPVEQGSAPDVQRQLFVVKMREITEDLDHASIVAIDATRRQIPASLENLRGEDLEARKMAYLQGRIEDQITWYSKKSRKAQFRMHQFLLGAIVMECVGIIAAALRAAGILSFDLLGIIAAVVAGVASWAQTRQYGSISKAYSIAALELATVREELASQTADTWPRFVDESEEAISREHTLWRSSRGIRLANKSRKTLG